MLQETFSKDFGNVQLKKSSMGQFEDGLGAFANRDFKAGEIVIKWNLRALTERQYQELPLHVNRFKNPNVVPNFQLQANIALRDIKKGEELSIAEDTVEDF